MQTIQFYQKIPDMECLQGDTLDTFFVGMEEGTDLTGASMCLILEKDGGVILQKLCALENNVFSVRITSTETAELSGVYRMHFCLTDADGLKYRKISGTLYVSRTAQGA